MTRPYNIEWSAQLQHELMPGVSVNFGWFRRSFKNDVVNVNQNLTAADFSPLIITNPLDGQPITVYNISGAGALRATDILETNYPDDPDLYGRTVTTWEASFSARLRTGANVSGGVGMQRNIGVNCFAPDNPNLLLYCDQRDYDIPYRTQFKLNGVQPLPRGPQTPAT